MTATLIASGYNSHRDESYAAHVKGDIRMLKEHARQAEQVNIPEEYEVLDARALGDRLGFKRDTILSYLSKSSFHRIPYPDRQLATGPIWYELSVRDWEQNNRQHRKSSRKKYNSL